MLFCLPALISAACSAHSLSASATSAEYFVPIRRLEATSGRFDARKAHLAHIERSDRVEPRSKEDGAMVGCWNQMLPSHCVSTGNMQKL